MPTGIQTRRSSKLPPIPSGPLGGGQQNTALAPRLASAAGPCAPGIAPFLPVENTITAAVSVLTARLALLAHELDVVPWARTHRSRSLGRQLTPLGFRLATEVKCGSAAAPPPPEGELRTGG